VPALAGMNVAVIGSPALNVSRLMPSLSIVDGDDNSPVHFTSEPLLSFTSHTTNT
jgi:hypothetical protein